MRSIRLLAAGASALALLVSACGTGGASPTTAPAAQPTTAPAKPAAAPSPAASPAAAASPSAAAAASPAASPKPAASPAVAASPSAAASPVAGGPKPTVKIASFNFDESEVLQELYGQELENNGYTVERHTRLGTREIVEPALESGQIDLVPEYLATLDAFVNKTNAKASSDPAQTQQDLQSYLTTKNITVLDFAQAIDTNGFVVTQKTASAHNNLMKMSDLQPIASQLVLGGPPECPQRPFCLIGLMQTYGLNFKDFKPLDSGGPLTVAALDSGDIDVGLLFTTDPNITLKNYVLLEDDKHLQLADNIAPVIRNQILTAAPDVKTLLNNVTSKLTTADLTNMNKQVGIDHMDASAVAKAYLQSKQLLH